MTTIILNLLPQAAFVLTVLLSTQVFIVLPLQQQQQQHDCDFSVTENSSPNTALAQLNNFNGNNDSNKYFYTLKGEPSFLQVERMTSKLKVSRIIDREAFCKSTIICKIDFTVIKERADKRGPPKMPKYTLCILDENDNKPQLPASHSIDINENTEIGKTFPLQLAIDNDSPANSANYYAIECPENILELKFQLHQVNGTESSQDKVWIILKKSLDRESKDSYECLVKVSDGKYQDQMTLNIHVKDFNDHSPEWIDRKFEFEIKENEYYRRIVQLRAEDADKDYGKVTYEFGPETKPEIRNYFDINKETGELRIVMKLDYENKEQRLLYIPVVAKDNGLPEANSATATLTITLLDENDNKPMFTNVVNNMMNLEIEENNSPRYYLTYLLVTDNDSGDNGKVNCVIRKHLEDQFSLEKGNNDAYNIYTKVSFDRESVEDIYFYVDCNDLGNPAQTNSVRFKLTIKDVNDNSPHFTKKHFQGRVVEGPYTSHGVILRVVAIDRDKKSRLYYSIDPPVDFVSIDHSSGDIMSHRNFDRETQDNYTFQVKVVDKSAAPEEAVNATDTATVSLLVEDINDNAPQFIGAFTFNVMEDYRPGNGGPPIGQLNATDRDSGENGTVEFECLDCYKSKFKVNKDGEIILIDKLDREDQETYSLSVVVRDKGRPSLSSPHNIVLITVDDVNDNPPRFPHRYYHRNISCNKGAVITGIQAEDKDKEPNNLIEYRMKNSLLDNLFEVNNQTAEIRLKEKPDKRYCRDGVPYSITLVAYDPKNQQKSDTAYIKIKIRPENYLGTKSNSNGGGSRGDNDYGSYQGVDRMDVNLFIVVTLVCVAIILAVLMLGLIIFLKRRQDREANYAQSNHHSSKKSKSNYQSSSTYPLPRSVYYEQNGTLLRSSDKMDPACVTLTSASLASSQVESRLSPHDALMCASSMSAEDLTSLDRETFRINREACQKTKGEHWVSCEQNANPYESHFNQDIYHTYQRMPALKEEDQRYQHDSYTDLPLKYIINNSGSDTTASPKMSMKDNNNLKLSHVTGTIATTRSIDNNKGKNDLKKPYCTISFV